MSEIDKITSEVPPTSFESLKKEKELTFNDIDKLILSTLSYEDGSNYKTGQAKQGKKQSSTLTILRDVLYNEVEALVLTKEIDKVDRSVNATSKKVLQQQIDYLLNLLEMSLNKKDNRYYILGLLIRSLSNN